jgi:hypothetical protein
MSDGTMTSQNLPGAPVFSTSDDPYPHVEARPLNLPDFVNLKPKNPLNSLRWVNRVAGEGQRLDEMIFAGFKPATPEEITMPDGSPILKSFVRDGKVIRGDLIAMLISRKIYEGALKHNFMRATARLHPSTQLKTGKAQLSKAVQETGAQRIPDLRSKLAAYRPGASETEKVEAQEDASSLKLPSERKDD